MSNFSFVGPLAAVALLAGIGLADFARTTFVDSAQDIQSGSEVVNFQHTSPKRKDKVVHTDAEWKSF